jgi:glycosyltransferase involved in cell wall biosynthesis
MHWRFSQYRNNVTFSKRLVATLFYHYDLLSFASLADVLFVPSFEFASFLPGYVKFPRVVELPPGGYPGCGPLNSMGSVVASAEKLAPWKMIYVGGCHPDLYDLRPLLEVLCDRPGFELTIVTRQEEWLRSFDFYKSFVSKLKERVKVVHAHGEELVRLYAQSDIACVVVADNEYFRIAYPLKLFEALGEGLPILSLGTGTISRFVQENQIGWNARSLGDLPGVIDEITTKGIVSAAKRARLISSHHSWNTRASKVRETLCPGAIDSSA